MDVQASYRQFVLTAILSCRRRQRHHYTRFGLIAAFGILAFIFSAISPYDDDIQQEFFQNNKSKQVLLAGYKTVSNLGAIRVSPILSALVSSGRMFIRCTITEPIFISHDESKGRIFISRTGDRSPPSNPS